MKKNKIMRFFYLNLVYKLVEKIFEGAIDDQKKNIIYYLKNFFSKLLEK